MVLEKAVAKILGGYYRIAEASISTLMNTILGCPIVDLSCMNPKKLIKAFEQKTFYKKMASIYAYQSSSSVNTKCRLEKIVGF